MCVSAVGGDLKRPAQASLLHRHDIVPVVVEAAAHVVPVVLQPWLDAFPRMVLEHDEFWVEPEDGNRDMPWSTSAN